MKNLYNSASAISRMEAKFIFQLTKGPSAAERGEALKVAAGNDNVITKEEYEKMTEVNDITFEEVENSVESGKDVNNRMPTDEFIEAHEDLRISKKIIAKWENMGLKEGIDKSDEGRKAIKDAMATGTLPKLGANQMMIEDSVVFVDSDGGLRIEANTEKGYSPDSKRGPKTNVMTLKKNTTDNKYYWNKSSRKSILKQ